MNTSTKDNVDYRLLNRLSNVVICSSCLQRGKVTPVPQVISERHALTNKCSRCRHDRSMYSDSPASRAKLLVLPH